MPQRSRPRLVIVLLLNLLLIAALVVIGLAAHSLGVLATGVDYLADASAIGVSLLALHLAGKPATPRRPRGYPNATNIAALINTGWLLILNIAIIITAIARLAGGVPDVHGLPVLIISGIAAVTMLTGALILGGDLDDDDDQDDDDQDDDDQDDDGTGDEKEDLNLKAVLLDTAADAAAAAGVTIAGTIIWLTAGWYWRDPAAALAIAIIVTYHAATLTRKILTAISTERQSQQARTGR
ncbi:cation diffusion facilitator family transporter [Actinoallomurus sp. NPDC050550]|uniref:cation diffusion facilitator family transporter n=1 Tax=Actinoallomurus sp. NPDC050550 TaxID=3154937 RepID=UPI0033C19A7D